MLRRKCKSFEDADYNFQKIGWMLTGNLDDTHINFLSANKITLEGSLAGGIMASLQEVLEAVGELAYEDKVEIAKMGTTLMEGGYLKTDLIEVGSLRWNQSQGGLLVLGGFDNYDGILQIVDSSKTVMVSGDKTGVVVKRGASFRMDEYGTGVEEIITAKTNYLNDHSFELLHTTGNVDLTHNDFEMDATTANYFEWNKIGEPTLYSNLNTGDHAVALYGNQAVITRSGHAVVQRQIFAPSTVITVSASAYTHLTRNTLGANIQSVIQIKFWEIPEDMMEPETQLGTTILDTKTLSPSYSTADNDTVLRHVVANLTVPTPVIASSLVAIEVVLTSNGANNYVVWDGAQIVTGIYPALYNPETQLFRLLRGAGTLYTKVIIGSGAESSELDWNDLNFYRNSTASYINQKGGVSLRLTTTDGVSTFNVVNITENQRVGINRVNPDEALHVVGNGKISGSLEIQGDHVSASTPRVVNVIMGTGNPPTASTVPQGTIFLKYT